MAAASDFLQAASNSAASTVTAPVDGIAWILAKLGLPIKTPIGGSDWARQTGFTKDIPQNAASLSGETIGMLVPAVASAKSAEIAKVLAKIGDNWATPAQLSKQKGALLFDSDKGIGATPYNADVDYFGFTRNMPASEFRKLAKQTELDPQTVEWLQKQYQAGKAFGNPFFKTEWDSSRKLYQITGHEGRHRTAALQKLFGENVELPVHIFPSGLRRRNLTEEMLQAPLLMEK